MSSWYVVLPAAGLALTYLARLAAAAPLSWEDRYSPELERTGDAAGSA